VFSAVGEDDQAAGALQTALIEGEEFPQIYAWLGDALIRGRELNEARAILEEAVAKWPSDVRFAKPLATLYATFGQGREALRTLERHLAARPDDTESLALGVEWIYHLHTSGAVAHSAAEDLKLARSYAAAYATANGSQLPLVTQWMEALEKMPRR
jgi:tetratricopeptide (TPR) repeat protein